MQFLSDFFHVAYAIFLRWRYFLSNATAGEGWAVAGIVVFIEKYLLADFQYALGLLILILCDTVLGVMKAIKYKNVSSRKAANVIIRLFVYCALIVGANGLLYSLKDTPMAADIVGWVKASLYCFISVSEFISILENAGALGLPVPVWILKRLRQFTDTGKFMTEAEVTAAAGNSPPADAASIEPPASTNP